MKGRLLFLNLNITWSVVLLKNLLPKNHCTINVNIRMKAISYILEIEGIQSISSSNIGALNKARKF